MIKLRLKFADEEAREFEVNDGERLNEAVDRALTDVPASKVSREEMWLVVVNGHVIEGDMWEKVFIKKEDRVTISPKFRDGDSGQLIKTALLITIAIVATAYLGPGAGASFWAMVGSGLEIAAVTIGASLLLNALIPPPVAALADLAGLGGSIDSSQMYSFAGQSNQIKRLGSCPKVYGEHRMYPNIAAIPYTEIATSEGSFSKNTFAGLVFTSRDKGTRGNSIEVIFEGGGTAGSESVTVDAPNSSITVRYQTGVSTATQIKAAMLASGALTALISVGLAGEGSDVQTATGQVTLAGGTDAGETVQYLYAVYDFGIGTYDVSQLKIGDTPLSSNSFQDFNYNFVDPAKTADEDDFDEGLKDTFQYYKVSREITSLSIALDADGDTSVQNTDSNPDSLDQEIVLDFICPRGLFGFSSNGTLGKRSIDVGVEFALVGSTDWHQFNDLSAVTSHQIVGGAEVGEFKVDFQATIDVFEALEDLYYESKPEEGVKFGTSINYYVKPNQQNIVLEPGEYPIWSNVFLGNRFLGKIQSVDYVTVAPKVIVTLNRIVTNKHFDICAFSYYYFDGAPQLILGEKIRISNSSSGVATITGKSNSAVYASIRFTPNEPGQYQVRVRRIRAYGDWNTQTGDALTWGAITTAYFRSPINTTIRHTFLEIKIRATDQLNGNISTLSGVVKSIIPVYDPDTDTWARQFSNNPAWVFADLLTGQVNKRPISRDKLHLDSLVEWADYCDEVPTPPPDQTFTEKRFKCNFVLDYKSTLSEILAQVGGSAQASLNLIDGKYGVLIDKFRSTPVQIFTPRNSKDFSSVRHYSRRPDGLKVTFIDPDTDWNTAEIVVYDNGFNEANAETFDSLTAFACTNHEQAWRFGRYMIAQNRLRQETINILVDFENLACTRGDYVQITQDVMHAGGTPMRVKAVVGNHITTDDSIDYDPDVNYGYVYRSTATGEINTSTLTATLPNEFDVDGDIPAVGDLIIVGQVGFIVLDCIVKAISPNDDQSAQLVLVEKADGIYDYESSDVLPDYDPQINPLADPGTRPPHAVTNLVVSDNTWRCSPLRSGHEYYVDLSWDIPYGSVYELFEIWVNDGRGYRSIATTRIKTYRYTVDQDRLDLQHGFKVAAVSASGKKLELIAMATVLATPTTKPTAPSDVENFNVGITDQTLQLSWSAIVDCDAFQYVLRYSPDVDNVTWEYTTPLAIVSSSFNTFSCQARTGSYMIKAIDYAGNESANASIAITTIPNLFGINDIESINEAPEFEGERLQTELLGEAVILTEEVAGDIDTVEYYAVGYYTFENLLDLEDIYTVRLQSLLQAHGLKKGELMSDWVELDLVLHLSSVVHADWNIALEYRATTEFDSMADWVELDLIDHLNYGGGEGFTDWRDIPQVGDVTGRIFQFRVRMMSLSPNVTPFVFDTTVNAYMPDRLESGDNLTSDAVEATVVDFTTSFAGPGDRPVVQISIDEAATGDYWTFETKTLDGFSIRFYDKNGVQVVRQFDYVAKGFGHKYSAVI